MKNLRLALLAATAATLVTAGAASAQSASGNSANLNQTGSNNAAVIDQSGGTNNTVGTSVTSVNQTNDDDAQSNTLTIDQDLDGNTISTISQNAVAGDGTNTLTINQLNSSPAATTGENEVTLAEQVVISGSTGNNSATITQNGDENTLATISQTNDGGADNTITFNVKGDLNGDKDLTGFAEIANVADSSLIQNGTGNNIELNITGNDNRFGVKQLGGSNLLQESNTVSAISISGNENQLGILQESTNAGDQNTLSISGIVGDLNNIGVSQSGGVNNGVIALGSSTGNSNSNAVRLQQLNGANADINIVSGDYNSIDVLQQNASGTANQVDIDVTSTAVGSQNNTLDVLQDGNGNSLTVGIVGDFNNTGLSFSGKAASIAPATLTPGVMNQEGDSNSANFSINGGLNAFALQQTGDSNSVTASITGTSNQLAVVQTGDSNSSYVTQNGIGNNAGVNQ